MLVVLLAQICLLTPVSAADKAGKVIYTHGAATARHEQAGMRFLGKGMDVEQGDTVATGDRGFVVMRMADDGRITLRPRSEFLVQRYEETDEGESVALRLLRGGLRSLTGLFAKRRPSSYRLSARAATIGIRGTEFDVRLCGEDCAQEAQARDGRAATSIRRLAGRVVFMRGSVSAEAPGGERRELASRARIYMGDAMVTAADGMAAIIFRDDTRMVLQPNSRFVIERYYEKPHEEEPPSAFFRLVRGGLRALTGAIGKVNRRGFRVSTRVATIGIRGTGFDLNVGEHCDAASTPGDGEAAPDCAYVNVWEGAIEADGNAVDTDQTAFIADEDAELVLLDETPAFFTESDAPRPDTLEADLDELFGAAPADDNPAGLYVATYDGETTVATEQGTMSIAAGEAARVDTDTGEITRLSGQPLFLLEDPYPLPSEFDEDFEAALDLFGDDFDAIDRRDRLECRIN